MLVRENFYSTLEATLNKYFSAQGEDCYRVGNSFEFAKGFIYTHINAIISKNPSIAVKNFLLTEYTTRNFYKRLIAIAYINFLLNTRGFFANKKLTSINGAYLKSDILIYPCNKKIRIFNFKENYVDVVVKDSFPVSYIEKEIVFRQGIVSNHILPIISRSQSSYREKVINGKPLARIVNDVLYTEYRKLSYKILMKEISNQINIVNTTNYLSGLKKILTSKANDQVSHIFNATIDILTSYATEYLTEIQVVLSHGDFHHGNIWIENDTNHIFIIDFETCNERSIYYDYYTLFYNLRTYSFDENLKTVINNAENYESQCLLKSQIAVVLIEDIVFQTDEIEFFNNEHRLRELLSYHKKIENIIKEFYLS